MEDNNNGQGSYITFQYKFSFVDGERRTFTIRLDPITLNYIPKKKISRRPLWTKLDYSRCENCPLDANQHHYCPIAVNFIELFDSFKSLNSYHVAKVTLTTRERSYVKKTTVQQSLGAMLGIYMVTSGCPIMEKLKPMVRFHLPFATVKETVVKAASIYLLGQYFLYHRGQKADLELNQLKKYYIEIQKVNRGIATRLRTVTEKDAFANAIVSLDAFAKELPWTIEEQLKDIEYIFNVYFDKNEYSPIAR